MMQRFDDAKGKGRSFNILNMKEEEAKSFYAQYQSWPEELQNQCAEELSEQIGKKNREFLEWILAIQGKNNELLGKIEVTSFDGKEAAIRVQIPNRDCAERYSIEVVEQFLKICKDNHYFETIELDQTFATAMYSRVRNSGSRKVNVA